MDNPNLSNHIMPLNLEEKKAMLPIDFEEYQFVFGFVNTIIDLTSEEISSKFPPEIGRWVQWKTDENGVRGTE